MKNQRLQSVFHPFTVTVAMAMLFFFGSAMGTITAADTSPETSDGVSETGVAVATVCDADMRLFAYNRLQKYRDDINTHFQNKASTASLMTDAVAMYDEFVADVNLQLNSYFPDIGNGQRVEGAEIQECMTIVNETIDQGKSFLRIKAIGTSSVKQTTALLDKYKSINQQLGVLNKSLLNFKSYMETFANKVPCYIDKKCNTG